MTLNADPVASPSVAPRSPAWPTRPAATTQVDGVRGDAMSASPRLTDPTIAALSAAWRAVAESFDATRAETFVDAVTELMDHADPTVSDVAADLASYFASFADGMQVPTRAQLNRIADFVAAIETGTPPPSAPRQVAVDLRAALTPATEVPSAAPAANQTPIAAPVAPVQALPPVVAPTVAEAPSPAVVETRPVTPAAHPLAPPVLPQAPVAQPLRTRPVLARNTVALLGVGEDLAPGLASSLAERGLAVEAFSDGPALLDYLGQTTPAALLIEVHRLRMLSRIAAVLGDARIGTPLGPTLAVLSPQRDVSSRLLAQRAGAQAYFAAPVDSQRVAAQLFELLGREELPPARALVVMRDNDEAAEVARSLAGQGLIARIANDAHQAWKAAQELRPDLALIDAKLPDTHGAELARLLREEPQFATLPVVLLADRDADSDRYDALMAGADEVLVKPVKSRHLAAVVEARLRQTRWLKTQAALASVRDPQSGLYRRAHVLERLSSEGAVGSALLFVLVDRHTESRDGLGLIGIASLEEALARALREILAASDLAAIYRDGAYMVLASRAGRVDVDQLAERIRSRLASVGLDGSFGALKLTISLGIAALVEGETVDARVARAEAAALGAQRLGGNRSLWHEPEAAVLTAAEPRLALRGLLSRPLPDDALRTSFRPLVALAGKLSGQFDFSFDLAGEIGGVATYAAYAPIANEIGGLEALERRRIGAALAARDRALQRGRQVRLFMPILADGLVGTGLVDWLLDELQRRHLSGAGLALELSSTDLVDRRNALASPLARLRKVGVRIGVSDYGRDFAAIHLLSQEPVEHVRLEPELVKWTQGAHAVAAALISLVRKAHRQGAAVLAPSVERVEQAQFLQRLGIDYGCGDGLGATSREPDFDFQRALW